MNAVVKRIIVISVVVAFVVSIGIYKYQDSKVYYNDMAINGNTIGNLYGDGLFCEANGVVYFANPNDDNALYKMNPDETNVEKICDDRVYYINADPHYIYYCRDNNNDESQMSFLNVNIHSLCRIGVDGKKVTILDDAVCQGCSLSGNTVLYYHYDTDTATTLYSIGIDGKNKQMLSDEALSPVCVVGDKLYYTGVASDHNLHVRNISAGNSSEILSMPMWMPTVVGDYVYYMDLDDNNRIVRQSLSDGTTVTITSYGTSDYNVAGNYLYYQSIKGDPDGVYVVDLTTLEETLFAEGQYNAINVTSRYVYFRDYFTGAVYHGSVGGGLATVFSPAIELEKK